jgi:putative endonuclease
MGTTSNNHERVSTKLDAGAEAEEMAVALLCAHGYEIVERNWRAKAGELDIVARDRSTLVFVEVRSRADDEHGTALEAVGARKQRQVMRVAEHYLEIEDPRYDDIRFDIVAITGGKAELFTNAYRGGLAVW